MCDLFIWKEWQIQYGLFYYWAVFRGDCIITFLQLFLFEYHITGVHFHLKPSFGYLVIEKKEKKKKNITFNNNYVSYVISNDNNSRELNAPSAKQVNRQNTSKWTKHLHHTENIHIRK